MLNTETLCARVTAPGRSEKRTISVTTDSLTMAHELKTEGLAPKTPTRCLTDAMLAALDVCDVDNNQHMKTLTGWVEDADGYLATRATFSLDGPTWSKLEALAVRQRVSMTQVVRALSHVAVKQVYDELLNR
jgi:hypothetical protein